MNRFAVLAASLFIIAVALGQPPRREEEEDSPKPSPKAIPSFPADKGKDAADGVGERPGPGVVVVGVRQLPERLTPARARTDAERWALDLLYEGLLRAVPTEAGAVFEPALADGPAQVTAGGRTFTLDPEAKWHDGSPVLANDVLASLERLRANRQADDWGEAASDAPRRLRLTLRTAHPDPAALCSFRVQPANSRDEGKPVGSGPFQYVGPEKKKGRSYHVFRAVADYGKRKNRGHRPTVKEVWFLQGADPLADFRKGLVDFVIEERTTGLFPSTAAEGETSAKLDSGLGPDARIVTAPTRRFYYLAFNTLKLSFGGDAGRNARRAVAMGVNREAILDAVWRQRGQTTHRALTGPFPAGSWAADPESPPLDDATLAAAELRAAQSPLNSMTLIFNSTEPLAEPACKVIRDNLQSVGMTIELKPLASDDFVRALAEKSYDLAYRRFDYRDDWFDPTTLFATEAGGVGGSGVGASRLEAALTRAASHGEFTLLRDARRRLHREFRDQMPFAPLWCPDAHVVVRRGIDVPYLNQIDPDAPLRHIDLWKAERR